MGQPLNPSPSATPPRGPSAQPGRYGMPSWGMALIVVGVLALVCGVGTVAVSGVLNLLGQRTATLEEPIDTSDAEAPGVAITLPTLTITVNQAGPLSTDGSGPALENGLVYWKVDVTFVNNAGTGVDWSAFSSSIQDSAGARYGYSQKAENVAAVESLPTLEVLDSGEVLSGSLFYEVPGDAQELYWIYDDIANGGLAVVKIQ